MAQTLLERAMQQPVNQWKNGEVTREEAELAVAIISGTITPSQAVAVLTDVKSGNASWWAARVLQNGVRSGLIRLVLA